MFYQFGGDESFYKKAMLINSDGSKIYLYHKDDQNLFTNMYGKILPLDQN